MITRSATHEATICDPLFLRDHIFQDDPDEQIRFPEEVEPLHPPLASDRREVLSREPEPWVDDEGSVASDHWEEGMARYRFETVMEGDGMEFLDEDLEDEEDEELDDEEDGSDDGGGRYPPDYDSDAWSDEDALPRMTRQKGTDRAAKLFNLSLLRAAHQIHAEALPIFYA